MDAEMAFYITDPVRILDIEQQIVSRKPVSLWAVGCAG
jgi:hypothetical protein